MAPSLFNQGHPTAVDGVDRFDTIVVVEENKVEVINMVHFFPKQP